MWIINNNKNKPQGCTVSRHRTRSNKYTYRPYKKPNDNPMYINVNSNHPPRITKQIPEFINRRLPTLSSNEEVFLNNIQPYREALKKEWFSG